MKTNILIVIISLLCYTITQAQITNTYSLENVRFKATPGSEFLTIVLEGKGKYERMDYPRTRIFINNALIVDTGRGYGVIMDEKHEMLTTLKEAPTTFECFVIITNMKNHNGDVFSFESRPPEKEKKE
jgi:hypothetical protein